MKLLAGLLCLTIFRVSHEAKLLPSSQAPVIADEYIVALKARAGLRGSSSVLRDVDSIPGAKFLKEYKVGKLFLCTRFVFILCIGYHIISIFIYFLFIVRQSYFH